MFIWKNIFGEFCSTGKLKNIRWISPIPTDKKNATSYSCKNFIVYSNGKYIIYAGFAKNGEITIDNKYKFNTISGHDCHYQYKFVINLTAGYHIISVKLTSDSSPEASASNQGSVYGGFSLNMTDSNGKSIFSTSDSGWFGTTNIENLKSYCGKLLKNKVTTTSKNIYTSVPPSYTNYTTKYTTPVTTTTYTTPTKMSMGGSEIENIFKKYGVYIAVGLGLMLLLKRE